MRNLDKIFKVVAFLALLLLSVTSKAQVPLYQLEYAIDSSYVIGALPSGEPIWVHVDSLGITDSIYFSGGRVYLRDGSGSALIPIPSVTGTISGHQIGVFNSGTGAPTTPIRETVTTFSGIASGVRTYTSENGTMYDLDAESTNELQELNLLDSTDRVFTLEITNGNIVRWRDQVGSDTTQYLNPYVVGPDTVGFWITQALDTIVFISGDTTAFMSEVTIDSTGTGPGRIFTLTFDNGETVSWADLSGGADSTAVVAGWGIIVTETSPNVWTVKADTSQVFTQYDGTLKQDVLTGTSTRIPYWSSSTTLSNSANLVWDNSNNELEIKTIPIGSNSTNQIYFGTNAGLSATSAANSNFFGSSAGNGATGSSSSNFFGNSAGLSASSASFSNFFGNNAGRTATSATNSNFFGNNSGFGATNATNSNFFGSASGLSATSATDSNFFGSSAGSQATSAANSNFFGNRSGNLASSASFSNFFGYQSGKTFTGNNLGSNNIIVGTNISLPNATANSMNLGAVLFGTDFYSTTSGNPSITAKTDGKIGIAIVTPQKTLDVNGTIRISSLDTDATAPTTSGSTKMVITDANGDLSFKDEPTGSSPFSVKISSGTLSVSSTTQTEWSGNFRDTIDATGYYKVELYGTFITSNTATGGSFSIYNSSVTDAIGYLEVFNTNGTSTSSASRKSVQNMTSEFINGTGATNTTDKQVLYGQLTAYFSSGAIIIPKFASEDTNAVVYQAGARLIITKLF